MAAADHQEQVRCIMRQSLLLGDYPAAAAAISSLMLFAVRLPGTLSPPTFICS
jgi:hypothetical protein